MKNLLTIFSLFILMTGPTLAQSDEDSHNIDLTVSDYVQIDVSDDLSFTFNPLTETVTGSGSPTVVINNGGHITVKSTDATTLSYETNLSDMKIVAKNVGYSGDFDLDNLLLYASGNITPEFGSVGNPGSLIGTAVLGTPGSTFTFMNNISQAGGEVGLTYEMYFVKFDRGTSTTEMLYSILPE